MDEWRGSCHCYQVAILSDRYALRSKKQLGIDFVLCEARAENEEIVMPRA